MRPLWLPGLLLLGVAGAVGAQGTAGPGAPSRLEFSLDRTGPPAAQYTVTLNSLGEGTYAPATPGGAAAGQPEGGRPIRVSAALVKKLFAAVPMVEGGRCETHNKGIAKTGVKVLRYQGEGRRAECTFNYSDDDRVNEAATDFQAISETLQFGDRLRSKLRFDRLGLDGELDLLLSAVSDQRALEVQNIAPVLLAIQNDERVMERARRKATKLLQVLPEARGPQGAEAASSAPGSSER